MKKTLVGLATAGLIGAAPLIAAPSAEAGGCTWYVYETTKNTTYWEYSSGNIVNGGFWKRPAKGFRLKTNEPFNGKARTAIKYHVWDGKWQKLSATHRFPYINRGAVKFDYCY
ncbi:hypothetical protein [Demetria terragena]|uniref:hypothetical protein n=1 Tax=Demetria terragena TaxID=63959 RepID=UPI000370AFC7|nr:hypothetical protein [Demetria terragena]